VIALQGPLQRSQVSHQDSGMSGAPAGRRGEAFTAIVRRAPHAQQMAVLRGRRPLPLAVRPCSGEDSAAALVCLDMGIACS
jgi:hypothetical protein